MDKRINLLIEQTTFLLEKQKELFDRYASSFDSLVLLVNEKLKHVEQGGDLQDIKDLQCIRDYMLKRKDKVCVPIKEDIDFLSEQLEAINQIKEMKDTAKAEEILNMIVSPEEKLLQTQDFKDQVCRDLQEFEKECEIMVTDLKYAIEQCDWHDLKLTLEAMESDDGEEQGEQEELSACSGCCGDCPSQNECSSEVDIFNEFKQGDEK